jgi:hypothetical protein
MLDDEFKAERARFVRDLADRADPFIRKRLLGLASRYEKAPGKTRPLPSASLFAPNRADQSNGENEPR